jgi:hypothetical protein
LAYDLNVGGIQFLRVLTAPLSIGTLSVDTSSAAPGTYEVIVSAAEEQRRVGIALSLVASGSTIEPLQGLATITVVPEPSAILLLVVGVLGIGHHFSKRHSTGAREC